MPAKPRCVAALRRRAGEVDGDDSERGDMTDTLDQKQAPKVNGKTVQEYIDELPQWPDGTALKSMPMTAMQFRIWALACAGKFFEGMVVFMTGVALPLISIQFQLNAAEKGMVTASSLAGILVGATALGGLADSYGRKKMFIIEMIIFAVFLVGLTLAPNFITLVICLFGAGIALGCDYPTAHMVISESIATSMRGRLVLSAFAFQAIGAFFGTALGFGILYANPNLGAWRMMYAAAIRSDLDAGPTGAERLRVPGYRRVLRHSAGLRHPVCEPEPGRVADDVRGGDPI